MIKKQRHIYKSPQMDILRYDGDLPLMVISGEGKLTRQNYNMIDDDDPFNQSTLGRTNYSTSSGNPFGDE